jgi:hypothetical protein
MNANRKLIIRRLVPALYVLAMIIGFLVSETAGIVVVIVAGLLSAVAWQYLGRTSPAPEGSGQRPRNRQRNRLPSRTASGPARCRPGTC